MNAIRLCFIALLLAAGPALAQQANPAEIAFWESVRDSKNPEELRAYLQQFPKGVFAPLAQARLNALERKPAAAPAAPPVASSAPSSIASGSRIPQVGDTWTYRLSYPKRFGIESPADRTVVIRIDSATTAEIVDQVAVDGVPSPGGTHQRGGYLMTQGASVFSPYFIDFDTAGTRISDVAILESACRSTHSCTARARILNQEVVRVPAGTFTALKIVVDQSWSPGPSASALGQYGMARASGGRTLTIWYAPEVKRAVKFSSRHGVGEYPPVDTHFDLELVSYQVK